MMSLAREASFDPEGVVHLPAALAQERLWFLDRLVPGRAVYNMPLTLRLTSPINRAVLERCCAELLRRHEALRTSFAVEQGRLVQVIAPLRLPSVPLLDLRRHPAPLREARLHALLSAEARRSFDLERGPLWRVALYRLGPMDHVVSVVMHHVISDAWSVELMARELVELYRVFDAGGTSPLEPLAIQYADWASWQRERLQQGALDADLTFFRRHLASAPTLLELPSDRARPRVPSYAGELETFVVDSSLAERLRALSREAGCTLYMTLLAAFAALLGRYTRTEDLLVGTPLTNRSRPELEAIIGLFVNTAVLRVQLHGAPTARELLERIRLMMLDVHAHGEVPFDKLVESLSPRRTAGVHPFFQVLFSLQASALGTAQLSAKNAARGPAPPTATTGTAKFELSLLMSDTPNGLGGAWEYSTELFDRSRIQRMMAHYERLLHGFVDTPDAPVSSLPWLNAAEARGLAAFEVAPTPLASAASSLLVHERIAAQAARTPDAVAVEGSGQTLTYAELTRRAAALARRLGGQGVGPDVRVGVWLRRTPELVVALLGILQAGGAYVPLDPTHPRERLLHVAADSGLDLLLTEEALKAEVPNAWAVLSVDGPSDATRVFGAPVQAIAANLAYVIYTSGTTGRPKGVAVTHASLSALLDWACAEFDGAELARVLASTSVCFDISVFELFLPLTCGGTVVLADNVLALAAPGSLDVTLVNTVPSALRELLHFFQPGPALRAVNLAGEALPRDLVERLHERAPGITVRNLYGPTETTVYSTSARLTPGDRTVPSLGRPIDGSATYVLDENLARLPVGVPGELYLGGAGLSRGYLGQAGRTADRYVPDPYSTTPSARMYRTGDLVRWREDGTLEYHGRADQQVKLRGYRIELGEIEAALRSHPRVREAVVALHQSPSGDAQLVAYAIMDEPAPEELERCARRSLPAYMVPSKILFLDDLPRTGSGKLDRAALPTPTSDAQPKGRTPARGVEATLCETFAAALELPSFDPDADFFAAGGHSLLATSVLARINDVLRVELPLSSIFEQPTPVGLAALVESSTDAPARVALLPQRGDDSLPLPLAFAQQGMWFYDRWRPGTALYNLPVLLPTRAAIDVDVLQSAVDHVVARHGALRTCFELVGREPVQRIVADARVKLTVHDLCDLPPEQRHWRARRLVEREVQRPFDLRRAPLLRVAVLRVSAEEQLIVLVMHHIVSDGWSTDIIRRDLEAAYEAIALGGRPPHTELPLQYGDYVRWQRRSFTPAVIDERLAYFREQLAGAPALLALPTDHPRPCRPTFRGSLVPFELGTNDSAALARLAAAHGATVHMAHLAVFAALLHQYTGQDDVVIGVPVAGRSRNEWRDVVGLFVNTVPIRIGCGGELTFATLLERTRRAALDAYAHQELPFDRLVQELSPVRDLAHHPIFQVALGFQELEGTAASGSADMLAETGTAKFDLSLSLTRSGQRVCGVIEYATDLFERASVQRFSQRYRRLVAALAITPDRPLASVAPLDAEERTWCDAARAVAPTPAQARVEATASSTVALRAARTDVERRIAEFWTEALGHANFGVDQSFFEVGGHSLSAVCVVARVAEEWGIELPFEVLFTTPTIERLAQAVAAAPETSASDAEPLCALERTGPMPLSFAQERLWFIDRVAPNLAVYNISIPMQLPGVIDLGALEHALSRLGDRHECLRARFIAGDSGPEQVFDAFLTVELPVTDLSGMPAVGRRAEAERLLSRQARHAFDLERGPLLRAHLIRLGTREHVLSLTIHHIVADAQSVEILERDLAALYAAECSGQPAELPELPVQFADFSVWQRAHLRGERLAAELTWWRGALAEAPALLSLPTDRPRPAEQSFAGAQIPFGLGEEVSAALRQLASEEQATPFMVLLALCGAVLGRWCASDDIVIGSPVIGRPRRELEQVVGFFSNTLPLRVRLGGCRTFRELLRRVRGLVIDAFAHQEVPFDAIVEELKPARSLAYSPLFQVMLAFHRPSTAAQSPAPRGLAAGSGTSKFDLTLFIVDETELHGAIEYATDIFDVTTIERLVLRLRVAAQAIAADPELALPALSRPSRAEAAAIARFGTGATLLGAGDTLAHGLIENQAAMTPSAPAVSSDEVTWTYAELSRRARGLSARLQAAGVGPDSRVAIVAEPTPQLIAAVLGIWLTGAACVPLDPSYPSPRLAFMAEDARARWLVQPRGAGQGVPALDMTLVELPDDDCDAQVLATNEEASSADRLAYVVYTSGSTGKPKGVAIPHRALVNLIRWQQSQPERGGSRRTLQFASPSFDVFFQELLLTLATGGELIVPASQARRDPALLIELCRRRAVERLFLPFVALRELAELAASVEPLPALREVITAGEQLRITPAIRRWFSSHPACRLFNQYGPSETHVVTEEALVDDPARWNTLPPIGQPIANCRTYVLDEELELVSIGIPGDLYLGGVGLARGYLDRPALTAERFLPDPHGAEPGARMYRSGDRARWLPDGRLEFLGRSDDQIKIRGYRIEVAEVETALAALPLVRQALVTALGDAGGENRLIGYVLSDDPAADPVALQGALLELLPEPLVPSRVVILADFPRTPSGKVDRRALPAPSFEARVSRRPESDLERVAAGVFCDVLGLDQVGVDESFFLLGGHSLLAIRVAARLRDRLGKEVAVRDIFEHPTVARLCATLKATELVPEGTAPPLVSVPRDGSPLASSFSQERLWFLEQMNPGSPTYNLTTRYELSASLSVDTLRRTLDELVRRHEAFRTVFRESDGRPLQVVTPRARASLEIVDLTYLQPVELEAEIKLRADEESRRSFDLTAGPLLRATLLGRGSFGYTLLLSMHHIISDAWSLRVLQRDLKTIYDAFERGARPSLPVLGVGYADFASWQRSLLSGPRLHELLRYWRDHLAHAPQRLELPADRPRSATRASIGATHTFELDAELCAALQALTRQEGATLFMTMLSLFLELLRRHSRLDDFLVGTPIGARPHSELENVVGFFVNTLVVRANLAGSPSLREQLQRVREEMLAAYAHADLPFERLVEELQPRRDAGFHPLVQIAFGLHHADADAATASPGTSGTSGNGTAKFELSLVLVEAGGRLTGVFEYDRGLFEPDTVARLAAQFEAIVRCAVRTPDAPLASFNLLTEAETRDVLGSWAHGAERSADVDLSDLVAQHARRQPTHCAAEAPDGAFSYAELNAHASRISDQLVALGVAPEVRVGVHLPNSKHLPVAFVGVLRAGGVYLPLDPALPTARLELLVRDAQVQVIITDADGVERLAACGAAILRVDAPTDSAPPQPVVMPAPEQLAYIVYTSGSTGQPKGVMVTHRGLRALVAAERESLGLRAESRILKFATPSFDAAIFELSSALSAGATLCLEAQDELLPRPELVAILRRRGITMLTIPPSSLAVLPVEDCPALRLLFVAGEACPAELVRQWSPGRRMINGYGPTETSVWATFADCAADGARPPIGRPIANAVVRILDEGLRPVPVGAVGELYIGGPGVARGYLGRPGLTAASFVPDPSGAPGARLYRTGDLARWRADGRIDFLGRVDGQVKVRGVRVELGEVEAAISALPGIATCAVIAHELRPGDTQLVAYVVGAPGVSLHGAAIRRALHQTLPRFLLPSKIMVCTELPRTPSGKVDRKSLPEPSVLAEQSAAEESAAAVRTPVEERVGRIWSDILGQSVGRDDDFFALGGHSLLVTRVLSRIRKELGAEVAVRRFFETPTLAAFCEGLTLGEPNASTLIPCLPRRPIHA